MSLFDFFWTFFMFFLWVLWIWLLITVFIDLFRDPETGGWAKALWTLFLIFLPLLGVLVYLIARGNGMAERQMKQAAQQQQMAERYIRDVASSGGTADELEKLAALKERGVITDDEFAAQKAKLLS